ncbi:MAG: polysaccharide biosynthesis C-terminal domain-containing protein, partial [Bacteroidia bacterium]
LGIYFNLSIWYKIANKTHWGAFIAIIGAFITIGFNIWLIPIMGYTGAAWVTLICYFTMTLLVYLLGQKYYPINYNVKRGLLYISVALLIVIVKLLIDYYLNVNEITAMAVGTIILLLFAIGGYLLEAPKKSVP